MTRRAFARGFSLGAFVGLGAVACGDVKSDLITGASGGSAGASGASMGGTSSGASGVGGAAAGVAGAGGAGGTSAGSGSANGGSGGTPECTPETADTDCTSSDRVFCHPELLVCVECVYPAHCDPGEDCSTALRECAVACSSAADCTDDEDRFCDTTIGFCVECLFDSDCPSSQCSNWSCD